MPRHEPRRPPPRMPRPNPAVAALGVGIRPDKWTPEGIIESITTRYTQLIKVSEEAKEQSDTRRQRLSMAGAYELALILANYYQDKGDTEQYTRWDRRSKQASSIAYRTTNPVASMLGVASPAEGETHEPTQRRVPGSD